MLTAILTASAILINRFFICKSLLIKIRSADLPRQESRTHPLLFCPRRANHQHHCNKFWSIWQCFKANCRISGKMAFQPAFRPEEGGDSVKPLANDKPTQKQQQRSALSGRPLCVNPYRIRYRPHRSAAPSARQAVWYRQKGSWSRAGWRAPRPRPLPPYRR